MGYLYRETVGLGGDLCRGVMQFFNGLDVDQWFLLGAVAVLLGLFCLRGFGSRSNY